MATPRATWALASVRKLGLASRGGGGVADQLWGRVGSSGLATPRIAPPHWSVISRLRRFGQSAVNRRASRSASAPAASWPSPRARLCRSYGRFPHDLLGRVVLSATLGGGLV